MLLDEGAELPGRQPLTAQVGGRDDRRRARATVDQGDLAEVLAGTEGPDDLPVDADRGVAILDQEEADAALALRGDCVALREGPLLHAAGELLQGLRLHTLEEGHAAERLHHVRHGHSIFLLRHQAAITNAARVDARSES